MLPAQKFPETLVAGLTTQLAASDASAAESGSFSSMNAHKFTTQRGIRVPSFLVLLAGLFFGRTALPAQEPAKTASPPPATETTYTRPCSANPVLPPPTAKKKSSRKPKHPLPPEPLPTCVEVKGEGIEIQEFLQNTAREQAWRIGENHASEDMWSYVRYLDPDELQRFADTHVLIEPVKFTSGKAAVVVRATDLGDGYARVQISTHIQGEGKSTDKTWAQPATEWPLNSKGVLEQELVNVLQTAYKPLQ
jgi:hypothetical protein